MEQYFQAKGTLHCTTKFCNYGKAEGAKEYAQIPVSYQIHLRSVGWFVKHAYFFTSQFLFMHWVNIPKMIAVAHLLKYDAKSQYCQM